MGTQCKKAIAIARVTVLESARRKDPFVVLILAGAIVFGAGLMANFGVEGLHKFVKDVGLTVTTLFSIILCVTTAARQLPAEFENRTLYPLLGKPITRMAFFLGKYVGVGILSSVVVVLFFVLLRVLLALLGIPVGAVFYQALYLRLLSMWFIAAGVMCLSLFLTHGANVTISLLACLCMQLLAHSILYLHEGLTGLSLFLARAVYWLAPHLELFDLSKKVIHEWPAIPGWVLAAMTLYAVLYVGLFLAAGCVRLRRMAL